MARDELPFAILGSGEFADNLSTLLTAAGHKVLGHIAEKNGHFARPLRLSGSHWPVFRARLVYADVATKDGELVFDDGFEQRFLRAMRDLRTERGWKGPILHPVAALDCARPRLEDRFYFFGLQGSGNSIYQTLINEIVKIKRSRVSISPETRKIEQWVGAAQYDYGALVCRCLQDAILLATGEDAYVPPIPNRVSFVQTQSQAGSDLVLCLFNVSFRQYFIDHVVGQHVPLYADDLDYLKDRGIRPIFCKRHPLDTLSSGLRKGGDRSGGDAMRPVAWRHAYHQMANFCATLENETTLRYEDLVADPIGTITNLASDLVGVALSREQASALWARFGDKQLPHASPGHYTGGRVNAWRDALSAGTLARLRDSGYGALIARMGYEVPPEMHSSIETELPASAWSRWPIEDEHTISIVALNASLAPAHPEAAERLKTVIETTQAIDVLASGRPSGQVRLTTVRQSIDEPP